MSICDRTSSRVKNELNELNELNTIELFTFDVEKSCNSADCEY